MLDQIFVYARVKARLREGPLGGYLDGFIAAQTEGGYRRSSLRHQARLLAQLSQWLLGRQLAARDLTESRVEKFLRYRKRKGYRWSGAGVLLAFLAYLRELGKVSAPSAKPLTPQDQLEQAYEEYLRQERRAAPATCVNYLRVVRQFLSEQGGVSHLSTLDAKHVTDFVFRQARQVCPRTAQWTATGLRSFLRFLQLRDVVRIDLAASVPQVANWRLDRVPAFLRPVEVERLLASVGQESGDSRDRAILLLLVRLGLRASEVAGLTLEDLDWERGEITIRGKSGRHRLPLPGDVGEALARYLRDARPACKTRCVFVRKCAPYIGFSDYTAVSCIVARALRRAGLTPPRRGAHLLRHTAATQMLRGGATLSEIGAVLGHRRVDTTAIYAKVDMTALRGVALPWPAGDRQ